MINNKPITLLAIFCSTACSSAAEIAVPIADSFGDAKYQITEGVPVLKTCEITTAHGKASGFDSVQTAQITVSCSFDSEIELVRLSATIYDCPEAIREVDTDVSTGQLQFVIETDTLCSDGEFRCTKDLKLSAVDANGQTTVAHREIHVSRGAPMPANLQRWVNLPH